MPDNRQPTVGMAILLSFTLVLSFGAVSFITMWFVYMVTGNTSLDIGNIFFMQCMGFTVVLIEAAALNIAFKFQEKGESSLLLFSLYRTRWQEILIAVAAGIAITFPLHELDNLLEFWFPVSEGEMDWIMGLFFPSSSLERIFVMLSIIVAAPVGEELMFRGAMMTWIRKSGRWWVALLVTTIFFALSHFHFPRTIFPILFVGLLLGWLTLRTGSVYPSIAAHAAFNGFPLLAFWSGLQITGFNNVGQENSRMSPILWVAGIAGTAICLYALEQIVKKRQKREEEEEKDND